MEEIEFEEVAERWSYYKVEDGTVLKVKIVLIRIASDVSFANMMDSQGNEPRSLAFIAMNAVGAKPFENLIIDGVVEKVEDMEFDVQKEAWNEYKMPNGRLLMLKPSVIQINRTGEIDSTGVPLYNCPSQ